MKKELEKTSDLEKSIDGWLTEKEGVCLYELAKKCSGKGVIVEIGSWKGKSTVCLAKGALAGNKSKVYAVDPHKDSMEHKEFMEGKSTFEEFEENIKSAGVKDCVEPLVKASKEAVSLITKPVEFVFIDGSHEYDDVKSDFELWYPKLIDGGIIALHDTLWWPGPRKVCETYVHRSRGIRNVRFVHSLTYAQKVGRNTLWDKIMNRQALFLKSIHRLVSRVRPNALREKS